MNISFILVNSHTPENVGSCARALKTMGFEDLRLVNSCDHLNEKARTVAYASGEILEKARIYKSLKEAITDSDFIIGSSAKIRNVKYDHYNLAVLPELIRAKGNSIKNAAIVFGGEESGLSNEELHLCDIVTTIPMKNKYPSLNLSHAVMCYAYILSGFVFKKEKSEQTGIHENSFKVLQKRIKKVLEDIEFRKDSNIYNRIMERVNILYSDDINLLHSICEKLEKKFTELD